MDSSLDKTDLKILNILQQNCTMAVKDIASRVGLSTTPTYERIKWMEEEGIIEKYVGLVNRNLVGLDLLVYCNITLKEQSRDALLDFERAVASLPEVLEVISISGHYDYMLKIISRDVHSYNEFVVNVIANIPNIGQYHSSIVLKEVKRDTALPL